MSNSILLHDDGAVDLLDAVEIDDDRGALLVRILALLFVVGQLPGLVALWPAGDQPRLAVEADAAGAVGILLARGISIIDHDVGILAEPLLRRAVAALPVRQLVVAEHRDAALRADLRVTVLRCGADQARRAIGQRLVQQFLYHRRDLDHAPYLNGCSRGIISSASGFAQSGSVRAAAVSRRERPRRDPERERNDGDGAEHHE